MGLTPRAALDFTRIIIIIIIIINTATTQHSGQLVTRLAVRLMLNISE